MLWLKKQLIIKYVIQHSIANDSTAADKINYWFVVRVGNVAKLETTKLGALFILLGDIKFNTERVQRIILGHVVDMKGQEYSQKFSALTHETC